MKVCESLFNIIIYMILSASMSDLHIQVVIPLQLNVSIVSMLKIKRATCSPYHSQTNGQVTLYVSAL